MAVRERISATVAGAGSAVRNISATVVSASSTVRNYSATVANAGMNFFVGETSASKTTNDVLRAEYEAIWAGCDPLPREGFEDAYRESVQKNKQAALCLSGGGIRSAAFSLGVLQVLAYRGLLTRFHYLSTVSGGGYIGGWLWRWIAEDPNQNAVTIQTALARKEEILQVSNLRANSNFLTPKIGITSADTWTGILLWVRNVLLTWTVFVPALIFAVLAPHLYLALMTWFAELATKRDEVRAALFGCDLAMGLLWIGAVSLTVATWQAVRNIPSHRNGDGSSSRAVGWQIVAPLLLWTGLVPLVLAAGGYGVTSEMTFKIYGAEQSILVWVLVFSFSAKILGYLLAGITNPRNRSLYVKNILIWVIVAGIATAALWLVIEVIDGLSRFLVSANAKSGDATAIVYALSILGPLGANLAHVILSTLYVGFRRVGFQDDADREWLARLSAVSVFPALLWSIFALICLLLPLVFRIARDGLNSAPTLRPVFDALATGLGVVSGFVAVLGGKSASIKLDIANAAPKSSSTKAYEFAVRLATLFFIVFLFIALAGAEQKFVGGLVDAAHDYHQPSGFRGFVVPWLLAFAIGYVPVYLLWYFTSREMSTLVVSLVVLGVVCALLLPVDVLWAWATNRDHSAGATILKAQALIAVGLFLIISITSMKIDVNRFSMHGVYRNRLVRAFLGAARANRKADPFTDFDADDNRYVSQLTAKQGGRRVLYPVINVTLNLVGGENLAWQERKASAFVITPLYCGSAALGREVSDYAAKGNPRRWNGAYVETHNYGGTELDLEDKKDDKKKGISLGTALTISGAAASPSMGYNSAPATAFLMTLFNVRLGAWLANPAAEILKDEVQAGPTSALKPLLTEALGLTDAKSDNVYLSDGGHFDNLGIYEMIRRRCRYILVVDADADENFTFEDLARSVRFAAIDLDATIEFKAIEMKSARAATAKSQTFAIGKIVYTERRNDPSWLIYLKPTYFYETAPVDVRSYGAVNDKFPHESTLDQWFGESQFESYRRLGEYLMGKLYDEHMAKMPPLPAGATDEHRLARFFAAVASRRRNPPRKARRRPRRTA
jgi:predicted acylesterase/phospholipase RssA